MLCLSIELLPIARRILCAAPRASPPRTACLVGAHATSVTLFPPADLGADVWPVLLPPGAFPRAGSEGCAGRTESLISAPCDVEGATALAALPDRIPRSVNPAALEGAEMPAAETLAAMRALTT